MSELATIIVDEHRARMVAPAAKGRLRALIRPENETNHVAKFGERFIEYVYVENGEYSLRNTAWYMERVCERLELAGDVLHVGCGFGVNPLVAANSAEPVNSVTGIDPDAGKINVFHKLIEEAGSVRVTADCGVGEDLPYDRDSFHWVICNECISHVHSIPSVLAEMHRVLRPGGRVVISDTACWNPYALWFKYGMRHFDENYQSKRRMRRYLRDVGFDSIKRVPGLVAPRNPWRDQADSLWWLNRFVDPKYVLVGNKP